MIDARRNVQLLGLSREALLFGVFGGVQLLADWTLFVALTSLGTPTVTANVAGRVLGAVLGYWLNGRYTFRATGAARDRHLGRIARFVTGWGITAVLSTVAVYLIEHQFGLHGAWFGKLFVDAGLALVGFVLSKYWIFR